MLITKLAPFSYLSERIQLELTRQVESLALCHLLPAWPICVPVGRQLCEFISRPICLLAKATKLLVRFSLYCAYRFRVVCTQILVVPCCHLCGLTEEFTCVCALTFGTTQGANIRTHTHRQLTSNDDKFQALKKKRIFFSYEKFLRIGISLCVMQMREKDSSTQVEALTQVSLSHWARNLVRPNILPTTNSRRDCAISFLPEERANFKQSKAITWLHSPIYIFERAA